MDVMNCRRCGRPIKSADAIACGYGRTCLIAEIADRLEGYPEWQVKKACEAFELGAVIATTRPGRYAVVSSDGSRTYLVDVRFRACSCTAAAEYRRKCYHVPAAIIASIAAPVALAA